MAEIRKDIKQSRKFSKVKKNKKLTWKIIKNQKELMFMSVPFLVYIGIFAYAPIWGWLMAFQNYKPGLSILKQQWVGFTQFTNLFSYMGFVQVIRNTVAMSLINLVLGMICPIVLA